MKSNPLGSIYGELQNIDQKYATTALAAFSSLELTKDIFLNQDYPYMNQTLLTNQLKNIINIIYNSPNDASGKDLLNIINNYAMQHNQVLDNCNSPYTFLYYFFAMLDDEYNKAFQIQINLNQTFPDIGNAINYFNQLYASQYISPILKNYQFSLIMNHSCNACNFSKFKPTFKKTIDLNVDAYIQQKNSPISLNECLQYYFTLKNDNCPNCHQPTAYQSRIILKTSQVLIINLMRSNYNGNDDPNFQVDLNIDLRNYKMNKNDNNNNYTLKSRVCYSTYGFFADCFIKRDNMEGIWVRYMDKNKIEINSEQLNKFQPVLLFYESVENSNNVNNINANMINKIIFNEQNNKTNIEQNLNMNAPINENQQIQNNINVGNNSININNQNNEYQFNNNMQNNININSNANVEFQGNLNNNHSNLKINNNFNQSASQGNINFGIAKSPQQIAKIENISTLSNQIKNEISIKAFAGDYNENMMNNFNNSCSQNISNNDNQNMNIQGNFNNNDINNMNQNFQNNFSQNNFNNQILDNKNIDNENIQNQNNNKNINVNPNFNNNMMNQDMNEKIIQNMNNMNINQDPNNNVNNFQNNFNQFNQMNNCDINQNQNQNILNSNLTNENQFNNINNNNIFINNQNQNLNQNITNNAFQNNEMNQKNQKLENLNNQINNDSKNDIQQNQNLNMNLIENININIQENNQINPIFLQNNNNNSQNAMNNMLQKEENKINMPQIPAMNINQENENNQQQIPANINNEINNKNNKEIGQNINPSFGNINSNQNNLTSPKPENIQEINQNINLNNKELKNNIINKIKKEVPKKLEVIKEEPKKEVPKKLEVIKEEPKKEVPKKSEIKKEEPKKVEPKKDEKKPEPSGERKLSFAERVKLMQQGVQKNPLPAPAPLPKKRFSAYQKYVPSLHTQPKKEENQKLNNNGVSNKINNMKEMLMKRGGGFGAPRNSAQIMGMPFGMPMPMKNKGSSNIVEKPKIEEREELDKKLEKIGIQKNKKKKKRPDF